MSNTKPTRHRGVLAPVLTPFHDDFEPDAEAFVEHCKSLIASDVGLAIFGTNSEANSLSLAEKIELIDTLVAAKIDPARVMSGTGSCSLKEAVALTRHSVDAGIGSVLMLPPFFFKNVSEDGVFAFYSEVIEAVGDMRLAVYLYHIPALSGVSITPALIERLRKRYPATIAGVKDSTGDWENTRMLLTTFSDDGFDVFPASEALLLDALKLGAAGCISGTANVNPVMLSTLYRMAHEPVSAHLHENAVSIRKAFQQVPMIPAMKAAIALRTGRESWKNVRPPLVPYKTVDMRATVALLEAGERTLMALQSHAPG
ncbi:dihydrodipicolinate synthase family protein [Paraburkholderia silviterrae]|uniref:Dihydrodipicolinate synthase family protein n=1 Tax=Paraburkholderia silviterrae TaxID=2528715 RepID=A0A4R5M8B7_9BURK|nr:dihydrodipicolinate synthase family protein [Paraburkholderia silviterrae]TDG22745.1 dihydrodipicolinate synthase family protein [Paraburkholderia silviterrae]